MFELDEDECFDIFPVFCAANIPVEVSLYGPLHPVVNSLQNILVLKDFLTKGHNSENDNRYPSGSFYIVRSETKNPYQDDPAKSAAGIDALGWNSHMCCGFC